LEEAQQDLKEEDSFVYSVMEAVVGILDEE